MLPSMLQELLLHPDEVSNYVPLANAVSQQDIVTQYNMKDIENAGLLKDGFSWIYVR